MPMMASLPTSINVVTKPTPWHAFSLVSLSFAKFTQINNERNVLESLQDTARKNLPVILQIMMGS